jgi:hypothetical protein
MIVSKNTSIKPILNFGIGYTENWFNVRNEVNFYVKSILIPFVLIQITYVYES